jgi:hypothetical protein
MLKVGATGIEEEGCKMEVVVKKFVTGADYS